MIEIWTNRATIWKHECCSAFGDDNGYTFAIPAGELPGSCPACGALFCGCCDYPEMGAEVITKQMRRFVSKDICGHAWRTFTEKTSAPDTNLG